MTCTSCGDQPRKDRAFPSAVVEINNPEQLILLRKVVLPATLTEADNPPAIGKYRNVILKYEDTGNVYIYSSDGIPTALEANVPQEILDKITDLEEDLATETETRATADEQLSEAITGERTARETADTRLETAINGLTDALTAETTARTTADATLGTRIDGVSSALSTETTAREAADTALGTRIDGVASSLAAETTARSTADTAIRSDLTTLTNRVTTAEGDIDTIEGKIPNQATAQNQLADKNFVNSSIATNTANFIGTFNSVAELEAYSGTVTNNDYAFVIVTDAQGNTAYDRYKYSGDTEQWMFEYELNNSSFTAVQWAAINSGITSGNVDKLTGLANIKTIGSNLSLSQTGELSATDTTYTAGTGLSLNGTQFSVDTTTIATQSDLTTGLATKQNTLTAGSNIQISNDTISATDTTYSPFTGTDGTTAGTSGLVPAPATTDAGKVLGADGTWVTGGPTVVQTTGTSTTDVMSQNAVTSMVYNDPATKKNIVIGGGSTYGATDPVVIGRAASVRGNYAVAIGSTAGSQVTDAPGGISLGAFSKAGGRGQMDISLITATQQAQATYGYNGSAYRLLTGLYDPQSAHDAATKGYVDTQVSAIGAGTRKATSTGWNTSTTLDYVLKSITSVDAKGAMFYAGDNLSDYPMYVGIGINADQADPSGYTPYLLTQQVTDDGTGTLSGQGAGRRIATYDELPATFTTNEWNALWA